jgi:hypothetical protein
MECQHPSAAKARKELLDVFNVENIDAWRALFASGTDPSTWKIPFRRLDDSLPLNCCRRIVNSVAAPYDQSDPQLTERSRR